MTVKHMQIKKYRTDSILDLLERRLKEQVNELTEYRIPIVKVYSDDGELLGGVYLYVVQSPEKTKLWIEFKTPDMYYGVRIRPRDFDQIMLLFNLLADREDIQKKICDLLAEIENRKLLRIQRRKEEDNELQVEPEESESTREDGENEEQKEQAQESENEQEEVKIGGLVKKKKVRGRSTR